MKVLNPIRLGDTVDVPIATFTKDQTTRVAWSSGSVAWYVNSGTSAIFTGTTFTSPWSSNTGIHHVQTVMSTANGFAQDTTFILRATAGTVDSTDITGLPFASVRVLGTYPDGSFFKGSVASIYASGLSFTNSPNLATLKTCLIVLTDGSDATGKSRVGAYTGAGNAFTVDPPWTANSESLPAGTLRASIFPLPPATTSSVPSVNVASVNSVSILGDGAGSPFHVQMVWLTGVWLAGVWDSSVWAGCATGGNPEGHAGLRDLNLRHQLRWR